MPATRGSRRLGLEVSNSAVRIAEITMSGSRAKLVNLGQVRLPPRTVVDGAIADVAAVKNAIERCIKEGGFTQKDVHLGVAGLRAITRELDMPFVPESELDSAVRLQALDVVPFPLEKTLMSARPLEEVTNPDGTSMRRILLAAAHRDLVDPLIEAVTEAGLTPVAIDLTSMAMIRALYDPAASGGGPEAIVAIGAGLTTVVVHENGVPHFVRTIAEGGDAITAAIAGVLDLPIDDAESTKRNLDQAGPHIRAASTAATEASNSLIAEIRSSIEYYSTLPGRSDVRKITLTGGGSRLSGLLERLQQQVRAQVVPGSALSRVDCSGLNLSPEELARRDPLVAVVIGLALPERTDAKPLDLMPPELIQKRKAARTDRIVRAVAVLLVLAMVGGGVLRYLSVHNAENQSSSLHQQVAAEVALIAKYDTAQREFKQLQSDQALFSPVVGDEVNWPSVLADLSTATPTGGTITSFTGAALPPPVLTGTQTAAPPRSTLPIATVSITIVALKGYPYFQSWYDSITKSGRFQIVQWSGIAPLGTTGAGATKSQTVTYTATLYALGTITSSRANEFKVPTK
jgi:type IV pilus assembly protein PilM